MKSWDIFLAHAGADTEVAETLFSFLNGHCRVFVDTRCLRLGDDWDAEVARAQNDSRITAVLISKNTEKAYYQREEIAAAIAMARENAQRVVPIFLHPASPKSREVPYGLRLKHGLSVCGDRDLEDSARRLRELISELDRQSSSSGDEESTEEPAQVPEQFTDGGTGMSQVTTIAATNQIELTIDRDFDTYTEQEKNRLLDAIRALLDISGDIRVISKQRGSVRLKIELTSEQTERLLWAVEAGELDEFGVIDARLTPKTTSKQSEDRGRARSGRAKKRRLRLTSAFDAPFTEEAAGILDHAFGAGGEWEGTPPVHYGELADTGWSDLQHRAIEELGQETIPNLTALGEEGRGVYLPAHVQTASFPLSGGKALKCASLPGLRNELSELAQRWELPLDDDGLKELLRVANANDPDDGCVADAPEILTFARLALAANEAARRDTPLWLVGQ